jgi:hypothetical protein
MTKIKLISIQNLDNWDLRQFEDKNLKNNYWPPYLSLTAIGNFASLRLANGYSVERISCIHTNEMDSSSGAVAASNKFFTQNFFDWKTKDIQSGDILISSSGALYINEPLKDLIFSNQFILLRPFSYENGLKIWAFLNSTPGINSLNDYFELERHVDRNLADFARQFLKNFLIPNFELNKNKFVEIELNIDGIRHDVGNLTERIYSWINLKKLKPGDDWYRAIASKGDLQSKSERKLEDLIDLIIIGRATKGKVPDGKGIFMPYVTPKYVVQGRKSDLRQDLLNASFSSVSKIGDLIITSTNKRVYFYLNDIDSILGTGVLAIRPKRGVTANQLLTLFASAEIQIELNYLISRGMKGSLSKKDMLNLNIPPNWEIESEVTRNLLPLRSQLDSILWS